MPTAPSSDDFDDLPFEIDDAFLATLKDTEDRYTLSLSQVPTGTPAVVGPPPAKKFKPNGWKSIREEEEENPDIVLLDDAGRYEVVPVQNKTATKSFSAGPSRPGPVIRDRSSSITVHTSLPIAAAKSSVFPTHPPLGSRTSSSNVGLAQPSKLSPLVQSVVAKSTPPRTSPQPQPRILRVPSEPSARPASPLANVAANFANGPQPPPLALQNELVALQAQFAELRKENEAAQAALRAAQDAQYAKAGEASNVRRAMEKQAVQHAEAIARSKAEKDEMAAAKARLEKELRDEMERLKTNLTFRAHELETSTRKSAWSVRKKPPENLMSATQMSQPPLRGRTPSKVSRSQLRSTAENGNTPARTQTGEREPRSSQDGRVERSAESRDKNRGAIVGRSKPAVAFPNFHNSFVSAKPLSPSKLNVLKVNGSPARWKGKEKENEWSMEYSMLGSEGDETGGGLAWEDQSLGDAAPEKVNIMSSQTEEDDTSNDLATVDGGHEEELTVTLESSEMEVDAEAEVVIEDNVKPIIDWRGELHHLMFSHRSVVELTAIEPPPLTLQTLLTVNVPSTCGAAVPQTYAAACGKILGAFGAEHQPIREQERGLSDPIEEIEIIGGGLIEMAGILSEAALIEPLRLCLELLCSLTIHIPFMQPFLLSPPSRDTRSVILDTVCEIIRSHLGPAKLSNGGEAAGLAAATLRLLEALAWGISDEDVQKMAVLTKSNGVLATLLNQAQPPWLTERAARLFCLLSTHPSLFRPLLSFPDSTPKAVTGEKEKDFTRIPLVDFFCDYLVNPQTSATFDQVHAIYQTAISSLSLLSVSHADGPNLFVESRAVIPSLVRCLLNQSSLIWDDDIETIESPGRHSVILQTLHLALTLLHHLAGSTNLRLKLQQGARYHNGLAHAFILCIGRLSYADAPEWLGPKKDGVERMREQARDLIESVVEGPEGDLIWAAYQDDGEDNTSGTATEDEEQAAADIEMEED